MKFFVFSLTILSILTNTSIYADSKKSNTISLSEQDAIKLALSNSFDIQIAKTEAYIARTNATKVRSLFDTFLNAGTELDDNDLDSPTTGTSVYSKRKKSYLGLNKRFPSATVVGLKAEYERVKSNSSTFIFSPYHDSSLSLTLKQSLGKNFFGIEDQSKIKLADLDVENSKYVSMDNIENAVSEAQETYWNLVLQKEKVKIIKHMFDYSSQQLNIYKEKLRLGSADEADFQTVYSTYLQRDIDLRLAKTGLENAKNIFLFKINNYNTNSNITPTDSLDKAFNKIDLHNTIKMSMKNRRDYKQLLNEAKKNDIELKQSKNALWPEIDLNATYKANGITRDFSDSFDDALSKGDDEYFIGLSLKWPFQNREAKANLEAVEFNKQKIITSIRKKEKEILTDISNALNDYHVLLEEIMLAKMFSESEEKKLKAEEKRIAQGRSTVDTLVRYQTDAMLAKLKFREAQYRLILADIKLKQLQNILLKDYEDIKI